MQRRHSSEMSLKHVQNKDLQAKATCTLAGKSIFCGSDKDIEKKSYIGLNSKLIN